MRFGILPRIIMKRPEDVDLTGVKILILPYVSTIDGALETKLRDFTANGGILVASFGLNSLEELGHNYTRAIAPRNLRDLFGLDIGEWFGMPETSVDFPGGKYGCCDAIEYLKPHADSEVLVRLSGTCFKGEPLLTRKAYGKGFAYYLAAPPNEEGARTFARWLLARAGYDVSREWPSAVTRIQRGRHVIVNNVSDQEWAIPAETGTLRLGEPVVRAGQTFIKPWEVLVYEK